jgi:hypothetical protein
MPQYHYIKFAEPLTMTHQTLETPAGVKSLLELRIQLDATQSIVSVSLDDLPIAIGVAESSAHLL